MHANAFGPRPCRSSPPVLHASGNDPSPPRSPGDGPPDEADLDDVQRSALRHETRRAIFEIVARTPGLNKRQIARRIGVDRSLADQHIDRLEAYDLVVTLDSARDDDEKLCFHPEHEHLWEHEDTRLLYGQAPLRHLALCIHDQPGAETGQIAQALEAAERTIQEHLVRLRELGLVETHRFQRSVEHHPTDTLEAWAEKVGHCYRRPWTDTD